MHKALQILRRRSHSRFWIAAPFSVLLTAVLASQAAHAVPSFARQTGKPCAQCHSVAYGPALTAYGRQFKLNGYVWGDAETVIPPIALMVQGGFTHTAKDQVSPPAEHFGTNDNLSLDQVSLFYGGRITKNIGAFVQGTYNGEERRATWDNLDIRLAHAAGFGSHSVVFGVSLNNNPSVQDLWNSTPAWSYPYITSGVAPGPAAAPMLAGGLGQVALGATAYAMVDDHLYLEAGGYRGLSDRWLRNVGLGPDDNLHLDGVSPYWRAAWQMDAGQHYFSAGLFGLDTQLHPDPASPATDRFNDVGFDLTYQYVGSSGHTLAADFTVIHEKQSLEASFGGGASANARNHLNTVGFDVTYAYLQTWVASAGLFSTTGSTDMGLYAPDPGDGSSTGSPDTRGYILQFEYVPFGKINSVARPWLNLRVGLQYTGYQRFNGAAGNYDGFGRSASDNNTLFAFYWLAL